MRSLLVEAAVVVENPVVEATQVAAVGNPLVVEGDLTRVEVEHMHRQVEDFIRLLVADCSQTPITLRRSVVHTWEISPEQPVFGQVQFILERAGVRWAAAMSASFTLASL